MRTPKTMLAAIFALLLSVLATLAVTVPSATAGEAAAVPMSFTDVFPSSGFGTWGRVSQAIAFDWDNDGSVDLVFPRGSYGSMRLFLNNGDGTFRESNADLAQLETVPVLYMCLGDVDNDGAFDAFVVTTSWNSPGFIDT